MSEILDDLVVLLKCTGSCEALPRLSDPLVFNQQYCRLENLLIPHTR